MLSDTVVVVIVTVVLLTLTSATFVVIIITICAVAKKIYRGKRTNMDFNVMAEHCGHNDNATPPTLSNAIPLREPIHLNVMIDM